jgi:hypothetical protein
VTAAHVVCAPESAAVETAAVGTAAPENCVELLVLTLGTHYTLHNDKIHYLAYINPCLSEVHLKDYIGNPYQKS